MISKFRAWDVSHRKMFMVDSMSFRTNGDVFRVWEYKNRIGNDLGILVNRSCCILMQFTGAKDMNGADIYEGDIIRKEECSPDDPAFGHYGSIGAIQYDVDVMGFIVVSEDDGFYDNTGVIFSFDEIEVVGNVYENPEMLEQ